MARLPYSRVVQVNLTRRDAFPGRRGFGVPLLISNVAVTDVLDATHRTKVYGSIEEVVVDHAAGTEVYKACLEAFSQNPRPMQVKVAYAALTVSGTPSNAAAMQAQLDIIYDADNEWYWVDVVAPLRDTAMLDGLIAWIQAKPKLAILTTNDAGHLVQNNTTCISARHKGTVDRTATFYHPDVNEYPGFALAARLSTFNFDDRNSAYTAKFKKLAGLAPLNVGSAGVQAATGFTPAIGQAISTGHMTNVYIDIGGQFFVTEGSTLTPNVFLDEIHATDWIIARTEEEMLGIFLNNNRVPYTDAGMAMLESGPRVVMDMGFRAGLVADDLDPVTGEYAPAVEYNTPSVFSVTASQRKNRIAPKIEVTFRYAGAIHWARIDYNMTF